MFLKEIRNLSRTTSFRLALGLSGLFFLTSLIFFTSVYFYFYESLKDTDRTLIASKLKEYSMILEAQGPQGLRDLFTTDKALNNEARFSVRVQNAKGDTLLFRLADDLQAFDIRSLEKDFQRLVSQHGWSYIDAVGDEDQIEILSDTLTNEGYTIQVGKSTSERQDFLERAIRVFAIATMASLLIGAFGGYWFSKRTLRPLRNLVQTTQMISKENLNQRVQDTGSNDEFSELVRVFNSMLNRIQDLVYGMQESLDSIAHDMKTPMTRLKASADLALARENLSVEDSKLALQECSENSGEILALLNSLLDIFEADSGAMKLHLENFCLKTVVDEVYDLYEIVAEEKSIELSKYFHSNTIIYADRLRFKQVLANLIDNAIKYSPPNSIVSTSILPTKEGWIISVADQGEGISEHEVSRIWERLYRGSQVKSQPGTGLGLSLVGAIMKAHGGKAWVEVNQPKGSQFKILIPILRLVHFQT